MDGVKSHWGDFKRMLEIHKIHLRLDFTNTIVLLDLINQRLTSA